MITAYDKTRKALNELLNINPDLAPVSDTLSRKFLDTLFEAVAEAKYEFGVKESAKNLISFDEHQMFKGSSLFENKVVLTGVACPDCGQEITFVENNIRTASIPPKVFVQCSCGWTSYMNWG